MQSETVIEGLISKFEACDLYEFMGRGLVIMSGHSTVLGYIRD
jgi:hypothetical protein